MDLAHMISLPIPKEAIEIKIIQNAVAFIFIDIFHKFIGRYIILKLHIKIFNQDKFMAI